MSAKSLGIGLLLLSFLALLLAPLCMPASYSWLRHTTSESAAKGVAGAWLARLGFLILGLTVLWLSERLRDSWSLPVCLMHGAFGLFMVGTAIFSSRPWLPNLPFDPVEDALHSFTATAMGFAFAIGVGLRLWQQREER